MEQTTTPPLVLYINFKSPKAFQLLESSTASISPDLSFSRSRGVLRSIAVLKSDLIFAVLAPCYDAWL
ncbi:hypothetical protein SDJN02_14989, partial [Cucurbita argyrosperma subsp. argyrosperma]